MKGMSLVIAESTKINILKQFDKTIRHLYDDVEIIKNWAKHKPHLPEIPSNNMIEFFLVNNKFSIETTKQKIDMYYSIRSIFPDIYDISNPQNKIMEKGFDHRILEGDFMIGDICIYDFKELKLSHFITFTPMHLITTAIIWEKVFSNRIKAVHLINSPPLINKLLNLLKIITKPKIYEKIHLHDSLESLTKHVPLEMLPKDYGGTELSLDELQEQCKLQFQEYEDRFNRLDKLRVNEILRPIYNKDYDSFGIEGSFKKISID